LDVTKKKLGGIPSVDNDLTLLKWKGIEQLEHLNLMNIREYYLPESTSFCTLIVLHITNLSANYEDIKSFFIFMFVYKIYLTY